MALSSTRLLCAYDRRTKLTVVHFDGESPTATLTTFIEKSRATEPTAEEIHQYLIDEKSNSGENYRSSLKIFITIHLFANVIDGIHRICYIYVIYMYIRLIYKFLTEAILSMIFRKILKTEKTIL